jgi:hypothetical protein
MLCLSIKGVQCCMIHMQFRDVDEMVSTDPPQAVLVYWITRAVKGFQEIAPALVDSKCVSYRKRTQCIGYSSR